jgi:hypothetical protein
MKSKPDISSFLDGATAKIKEPPRPDPATGSARITKTIRLAADLNDALRDAAYKRTRSTGRRVAESDLIEEALRKYFST